jgi:hypothetical protein
MDDDGFRLLPGAPQAIEVLMVMEWIPTGPVHQPNIRIIRGAAIEFVGAAGLQQQIGDARDRDRRVDRIWRRRDFWTG